MLNAARHLALAAVVFLSALAPGGARADHRDLYLTLTLEPQISRLTDPIAAVAQSANLGGGAMLSAYYGFTNALHAGIDLHFNAARNASFDNVHLTLQDGSPSQGVVYEDRYGYGANALVAYRFDTGHGLAPVARGEVGFASLSYSKVQHTPTGQPYTLDFPSSHQFVLELRAALLAEYRLGDHFVTSFGLAFTDRPNSLNPWDVSFPLTVGYIWD